MDLVNCQADWQRGRMWGEGFTLRFNLRWLDILHASLRKTENPIKDEKQLEVIIFAIIKLIIQIGNFPLSKHMFVGGRQK